MKSTITKRRDSRTPTTRPVTTFTGRAVGALVEGKVVAVMVRFRFAELPCGSGLLHAAALSRTAKKSIVEGYDIGRGYNGLSG